MRLTDLKDASFHVPVDKLFEKYLRFAFEWCCTSSESPVLVFSKPPCVPNLYSFSMWPLIKGIWLLMPRRWLALVSE